MSCSSSWSSSRSRCWPSSFEGGEAVNAENAVGLVLASLVTIFLFVALLFPEKFWA